MKQILIDPNKTGLDIFSADAPDETVDSMSGIPVFQGFRHPGGDDCILDGQAPDVMYILFGLDDSTTSRKSGQIIGTSAKNPQNGD